MKDKYTKIFYEDNKFKAIIEGGEARDVGVNMTSMLIYTYFEEDGQMPPPPGWEGPGQLTFLKEYNSKLFADITSGKIKINQ